MLNKRLIGVVTVRQGWAVQSYGYERYLPLGKPELLIENLDRWGVDEILIQCIDRSTTQTGPDLGLLKRTGKLSLSTPLIYGGGIRSAEDAVKVVMLGADRVLVDSMLWDAPRNIEYISRELGIQALIANLPVSVSGNILSWRNYRSGTEVPLNDMILSKLNLNWVSEIMLSDWQHEGAAGRFDLRIPEFFANSDKSIIVFGGISESDQMRNLFTNKNIVGVGVGNFLSFKEHAYQKLKRTLVGLPLRASQYEYDIDAN